MKQTLKENLLCFIVYGAMCCFVAGFSIWLALSWQSQAPRDLVMAKALSLGSLIFFVFLVISFFWRSERRTILYPLLLIEYVLHVGVLFISAGIMDVCLPSYLLRLFFSSIFFVLLPGVLAVVLGMLAGRIRSDFWSSLMMVLVTAVFVFPGSVYTLLKNTGLLQYSVAAGIYKRMRIFNAYLGVSELQNPYNPFSVSVSRAEWIIALLILCLAVIVLMNGVKLGKMILYLCSGFCLFCSCFLLYDALQPENEYYVMCADSLQVLQMGNVPDSWHMDEQYYKKLGAASVLAEPSEFSVADYDITITPGRTTRFVVKCEIAAADSEQLCFTLYHNYKITAVTDEEANELSFSQSGDTVTVYNEGGKDRLIFEYEGAAPVYMADSRHIEFPEYYKYYPVAGIKPVYDLVSRNYNRTIYEDVSNFHIKVLADYTVYSNLPASGVNEFAGTASGVTLLGGIEVGVAEAGDARIIYPKLLTDEKGILEQYQELMAVYAGDQISLSGKDWLVTGYKGGTFNNFFNGGSYFCGSYEELVYMLPYDLMASD